MKLQQTYTNIEQSKRLIELGVPTESADMFYCGEYIDDYMCPDILSDEQPYSQIEQEVQKANKKSIFSDCDCLPCWSVGRLIEIINICSMSNRCEVTLTYSNRWYVDHLVSLIALELRMGWFDFSKLEL